MLLQSEKKLLELLQNKKLSEEKAKKKLNSLFRTHTDRKRELPPNINQRLAEIKTETKSIISEINIDKTLFKEELAKSTGFRSLRSEYIKNENVISVFESTLTRTLGLETNQLYDDIIIVRVYFFEVLKDIILNGFMYNGEKFICLTASAGQIRTKKVVFIKEKLWTQHSPSLMCGLTLDSINAQGGINVNKYLAYLALCNSATDVWGRFNIRKTIVVDDMETLVRGTVDYIDDKTFIIERKEMDVPINHTDGCGMMLPSVNKKNLMIRLPWVKGMLAVFPFDKFIKEANAEDPSANHGVVTDIYGKHHDVLAEGIEIIFTKSQFKMWKYYFDWEDYIEKFISNGCVAGICNEEEDFIGNTKLNYQVLQTLTDVTDDELKHIASKTIGKIQNLCSDRNVMLNVFHADDSNPNRNDFQECLKLYPELLTTSFVKDTLKAIRGSLICEARSGKLDINGKYLFLIPDLYAFSQRLFLGAKEPEGLLKNGEVFCSVYRTVEKLDCLRSPHLSREHAVRNNVVDAEKRRWFQTPAVFTSCHDLISKILMFDNDGDKSLVCSDKQFVEIAERHMRNNVPLFYNMAKAGSRSVGNQDIYDGMIAAYTGGKIGVVSNNITKIWNTIMDERLVALLCLYNNSVIDYAKTLYKPDIPEAIQKEIDNAIKCKVPHFFIYAKGKTEDQVEEKNGSTVNRLEALIPSPPFKFKNREREKFNYKMLMQDKKVVETHEIIEAYNGIYKKYKHSFSSNEDWTSYGFLKSEATKTLTAVTGDLVLSCDMLIHYLFHSHESKRQNIFWLCFGDIVRQNIEGNLREEVQCEKCGVRFLRDTPQKKLCSDCDKYIPIGIKTVKCIDCGTEFEVSAKDNESCRCVNCKTEHNKKVRREQNKRQYKSKLSRSQFKSQSQSIY